MIRKIEINVIVKLVLLLIALNGLFYCVYIPLGVCKIVSWIARGYLLWLSFKPSLQNNQFRPVKYIVLLLLFSVLTVLVFHDQSPFQTIRALLPWFDICFCYYLFHKRYTLNTIFASFIVFAVIWLLLYLWAVVMAPNVIFDPSGMNEFDLGLSRGWYRIKISGEQINRLLLYCSLHRYVVEKDRKFLLLSIYFLFTVLLSLSRQHILIAFVMYVFIISYEMQWRKKIVFVSIISLIVLFVIPHTQIYQNLSNLTEDQMSANGGVSGDIRTLAYNYYLFDFNSSNLFTTFLGNGICHADSDYGKYMYWIISSKGFILSDIGFAGLFIYFGLLGLAVFSFFFYKIVTKVPKHIRFVLYYAVAVLLGNIASHELDSSLLSLSTLYYIRFYSEFNVNLYCSNQ